MRAWTGWQVALELIGALGPGWGRRDDGICSVGRANVFSFGANVFSFWPNVFTFWRNVFTLAGQVFSFGWGALVGNGAWKEGDLSSFGRLRTGFDELRAGPFGRLRAGSSGKPR